MVKMGDYVERFKEKEDLLRHEPLVVMETGDDIGDQQEAVIDSNNTSNNKKNLTSTGRPKRGQANRRERVRTENVNAGFDKLRKLIPTDPEDRKLSKIEILRLATSYIKHLYNLTRANSCLEADYLDLHETSESEDEEDPHLIASPDIIQCRASRNHVCTFCLMMTKVPKGG